MISAARRALSRRLAGHERRRLQPPERLTHAPMFVISLPRSGSTLLYQLLLQRFRLAYFSNLMAAFPDSPVTVAGHFGLARRAGSARRPREHVWCDARLARTESGLEAVEPLVTRVA